MKNLPPSGPAMLDQHLWFPDPRRAVRTGIHRGLVAVGGDLGTERLLLAYRLGIFPWTVDPITWWSPDPRGIFELGELHRSRSLKRTIRKGRFEITRNRAFAEVIRACATVPRPGSWISEEFIEAYCRLHREGHAHSVECWSRGELAGGVYGVAIGGLFAGESMFHRESDASKVAVAALHDHLIQRGFQLFDIQMVTEATATLGARQISRDDYLSRLGKAVTVNCQFQGPDDPERRLTEA